MSTTTDQVVYTDKARAEAESLDTEPSNDDDNLVVDDELRRLHAIYRAKFAAHPDEVWSLIQNGFDGCPVGPLESAPSGQEQWRLREGVNVPAEKWAKYLALPGAAHVTRLEDGVTTLVPEMFSPQDRPWSAILNLYALAGWTAKAGAAIAADDARQGKEAEAITGWLVDKAKSLVAEESVTGEPA